MIGQIALLASTTITAAVTAALSGVIANLFGLRHLAIEANFTYGSSGTNLTCWVQTSFDGGVTWIDIACFYFTTSSARKVCSLNAETSVTTVYTPLDGTLANNTVKNGLLGDRLRVKYTSTDTYATATTIEINIVPKA